jgi:hypothetical protein
MTKRDRKAIVFTVLSMLLAVVFLPLFGDGSPFILFGLPVVLYWSYRFIKGDISFLGGKSE